jgi:hypothetical protein
VRAIEAEQGREHLSTLGRGNPSPGCPEGGPKNVALMDLRERCPRVRSFAPLRFRRRPGDIFALASRTSHDIYRDTAYPARVVECAVQSRCRLNGDQYRILDDIFLVRVGETVARSSSFDERYEPDADCFVVRLGVSGTERSGTGYGVHTSGSREPSIRFAYLHNMDSEPHSGPACHPSSEFRAPR